MTDRYEWHRNAMRGVLADDELVYTEEPQCGWYKRTLVKGGPQVPARIWIERELDPMQPEAPAIDVIKCEIGNRMVDPVREWTWLCQRPISQSEYNYLRHLMDYAAQHDPQEPLANPRKPMDWTKMRPPVFKKEDER